MILFLLTVLLDPQLISNIRNSAKVIPFVRSLSHSRASTPASSVGTPRSHRSATHSQDEEALLGQQEIVVLARRILEYVEGDEGFASSSVGGSQVQPGSSIGSSQRDHEELRRSVREAFAPGSHR